MAIKRSREDMELERTLAMANYLILLSRPSALAEPTTGGRVYECKTCNRQFPSFQALGGHRASHKKPRLSNGDVDHPRTGEDNVKKPKVHECTICGLEFSIGQALGGHMRRHRAALTRSQHDLPCSSPTLSLSLEASSRDDDENKRVMCLDLNLTPLENGLMEFSKLAPIVC